MCTTFTTRSFVATSSTITTNDIGTSAYCYAMLVAYCQQALSLYNLEDGPTETCSVCGKPFSQCWCNASSKLDSSPGSSDRCETCDLPFSACACGQGTRQRDGPTETCSVCGKPYSQCWCNVGSRLDGPTETCSVCGKPFSQCWCNVGSHLDSSPGSSDLCKTCNLPFAACAGGRGTRKYDGPDETCSVCGKSYSQCWCNAGG